jgi:hypothetical protein
MSVSSVGQSGALAVIQASAATSNASTGALYSLLKKANDQDAQTVQALLGNLPIPAPAGTSETGQVLDARA